MKLNLAGAVREIDLVVFDCDGVLLDTMPAKRAGSREFVQSCAEAGIKRYVLSGTPQQPLEVTDLRELLSK